MQQGVDRVAKQRVGIVAVQYRQISGRAQIGQQQKSALEVLRQHLRNVHARLGHQAGHRDERPAVFPRRWRIHCDQRLRPAGHAEVASEAGVFGGGSKAEGPARKLLGDPALERECAVQRGSLIVV